MQMPWDRFNLLNAVRYKGGGGSGRIITEDMVASAERAGKDWNDYVERWKPSTDKYIQSVSTRDMPALETDMRGKVNADIAQGTKALPPLHNGSTFVSNLAIGDVGSRGAAAMEDVTNKTKAFQAGALGNIVAIGRGQQAADMGSQTDLATSSANSALARVKADTEAGIADNQSNAALVGSISNLALNTYMKGQQNEKAIK